VSSSLALALALSISSASSASSGGYRLASTIKLGGDDHWDYVTLDQKTHRLFVSRQSHVVVVDVTTGKVVGDISGTDGVHGIAIAGDLGRGFTSNGKAGTVTVFDLASLTRIVDVKTTGENPDAIVYDDEAKLVFAMNGRSKNVTAIDAKTATVKGSVDIGGKPEFAAVDGARLFVNLEDQNQLVAIDTAKLAVVARFDLPGCEEPGGLSVDKKTHRLFVGCGNQVMAIVDDATGKIVQTLKTGDHTDATAFDAKTGNAFASNGDGTLTVIHEDAADKFLLIENAATEKGARTMALDDETGAVYLPTADFGPPPPPTPEHPKPRPSMVKDTFRVIVMKPAS
jgi:YVTN family beta-propeller protein